MERTNLMIQKNVPLMKYLYGASVQGIQSFIFQTNQLKEIVGASQLVKRIVKEEFNVFCQQFIGRKLDDEQILINVAGNLKCILEEDTCRKIVQHFPKYISNYAPGITISQAVVELGENLKEDMDVLEQKLKVQRNKAVTPIDFGFMGLNRARRTGGVGHKMIGGKAEDRGTEAKTQNRQEMTLGLFSEFSSDTIRAAEVPFDLNHITKRHENDWIAIVHADGNGLGRLLSNLGEKVKGDNQKAKTAFRTFSVQLEKATKEAAQEAFETVLDDEVRQQLQTKKMRLPFRPVVLGGDDVTIIIRADLAYEFTKTFLKAFEQRTAACLEFLQTDHQIDEYQNGLTACAGIAYVKTAYPFHYGAQLAEELTAAAKKFSKSLSEDAKPPEDKNRSPSSLYFYRVQASFLEKLSTMLQRTHRAKAASVSLDYGPYLIHEGAAPSVDGLEIQLAKMKVLSNRKESSLSIGKLRHWLTELNRDKNRAQFMLNRMYQIDDRLEEEWSKAAILEVHEEEDLQYKTIIHDLIVLSSF